MTALPPTAPFPQRDVTEVAVRDRWTASLDHLSLDCDHVTVVAPHPDDETFGCGGLVADLLASGTRITVVTASDGASSHPRTSGLAAIRRAEQIGAVRALGCPAEPIWLGLADGALASHRAALRDGLASAVAGADLVIGPWPGDRHPDHEVVGEITREVARRRAIPVISYPVWLWRWGRPQDLDATRCRSWALSEEALRAKRAAIGCYPSQTSDLVGEVIVDPAMVQRFSRPFEVFTDG